MLNYSRSPDLAEMLTKLELEEVLIIEKRQGDFPKITIITVSYNCANTIAQTLQSVSGQTYPNIEYIVIDGGSTDGTVEIIKQYQDKISYWISEPDSGIYDAMNKGIRQASGDYIYFLGSDDCLLSRDIIGKVAQILASDGKVDILSAPVWAVDEALCLQSFSNNQLDDCRVNDGYNVPHQGMLTRRNLLQQAPFNTDYQITGDYDFLLKCYFNPSVQFKYVDFPIAFYSTSGVSSLSFTNALREQLQLMIKYKLNQHIIIKIQRKLQLHRRIVRNARFRLRYWVKVLCKPIYRIDFFRQILLPKSSKHSCEWQGCRWCKWREGSK